MAGDATVEVEDDAVVEIEIDGDPVVDTKPVVTEAEKPPRTRTPQKPSSVDEATAALSEALKTEQTAKVAAEAGRVAAEATANAERQRAEAAQRQADKLGADSEAYREQAETREIELLGGTIASKTREIEAAETAVTAALDQGDGKALGAAQRLIGRLSAELVNLEVSKKALEDGTKKTATTEGRVEAPQVSDAFEQYVSTFAPAAQTWLRSHRDCVPPQFGGNAVANSKMMAGHYEALAQGKAPNTPEYFQVIEERTGHRTPVSAAAVVTQAGEAAPVPAKPKPRTAMPSAPPSRDPPTPSRNPSTRTVTLTRDQQEAARISFPHKTAAEANALYARNLVELEAEGKMGRLTH